MTLWRLHDYSDPEGEYRRTEVVCLTERSTAGYRLLVEYGSVVPLDEVHISAAAAQAKAEVLREELLRQGWTVV